MWWLYDVKIILVKYYTVTSIIPCNQDVFCTSTSTATYFAYKDCVNYEMKPAKAFCS